MDYSMFSWVPWICNVLLRLGTSQTYIFLGVILIHELISRGRKGDKFDTQERLDFIRPTYLCFLDLFQSHLIFAN